MVTITKIPKFRKKTLKKYKLSLTNVPTDVKYVFLAQIQNCPEKRTIFVYYNKANT